MIERYHETALERRARYLRLAREAKELAAKSKTMQMREACLAMSQSWLALASDLDSRTEALANWTREFAAVSGIGDGAKPAGMDAASEPPAVVPLLEKTGTVSYEPSPHAD